MLMAIRTIEPNAYYDPPFRLDPNGANLSAIVENNLQISAHRIVGLELARCREDSDTAPTHPMAALCKQRPYNHTLE